jgi:hypothetical protein
MASTRLSIARPDILAHFEGSGRRVFRQSDIAAILAEQRAFWRLTKGTSTLAFIRYLIESARLRRVHLKLPHRPETLYTWGEVSPFVIASNAKPGAYVCHYSAMHLHELTEQVPETIYANHEQRPTKPPSSKPTQESIDNAFRGRQRFTTNIAPLGERLLCLINGKHTGRLGVVQMRDQDGQHFDVTSLERTLIDITVRPYYAGGTSQVLDAFRRAASRVSLNTLSAMLKKMDFVYPYEQAIGFYLDRSGAYESSRLDLFRRGRFEFDFYLTYAMDKSEYSPDWRLYFPAGL